MLVIAVYYIAITNWRITDVMKEKIDDMTISVDRFYIIDATIKQIKIDDTNENRIYLSLCILHRCYQITKKNERHEW